MSPKLPVVSGPEVVTVLKKLGFVERRWTGSHCILSKPDFPLNISVPCHGRRPLKAGTLRRILRDCQLTIEQFCQFL